MNFLKKSVIATGLAAGLFATSATAASLDVDVDVTIPDVLILYAYTDIDLSFAAGDFAALLDSNCTSDDCASAITATEGGTISGGAVDLNIGPDLSATGTSANINIQNSWAVRALGYGTFNASVADNGSESAVSNLDISPASGTPSMTATTGDVSFDVDLTSSDLDDGLLEANYTITVTGS
jgi:hypothetical protein